MFEHSTAFMIPMRVGTIVNALHDPLATEVQASLCPQVGALRCFLLFWILAGACGQFPGAEAAASEATQSWSHLRGPSYHGEVTEPPIALPWPSSGPPLLWKVALGEGYSGFIAVDGKVYTQVQTRAGQEVVCLDLESGEVLWRYRYGFPWELGATNLPPWL